MRLVKDFKGRSKGFGYLVFKSCFSVEQALKLDRTRIKGRPLFISRCNQSEESKKFKYSLKQEKEKLFIRGLPKELDEGGVKQLFDQYGPIKELRLVTFRNGYSKGTCYITYSNEELAEKVRKATDGMEVQGRNITVLISDPSKSSVKLDDNKNTKFITSHSTSTAMKPRLALIPRALQRKSDKPSIEESKSSNGMENNKQKSNQDFREMLLKK